MHCLGFLALPPLLLEDFSLHNAECIIDIEFIINCKLIVNNTV